MLTLLTGGARSGKSRTAVRMAAATGRPVHYVATAEPLDEEMAERIERHRAERPSGWTVHEEPIRVGSVVDGIDTDAVLIVDCLALWVTNQLGRDDGAIVADADALGAGLAARRGPTIVVTNEVGSGIVPAVEISRRFRDVLGSVNQCLAAHADQAYLCVAGRVLRLDDPETPDV